MSKDAGKNDRESASAKTEPRGGYPKLFPFDPALMSPALPVRTMMLPALGVMTASTAAAAAWVGSWSTLCTKRFDQQDPG